MRGFGLRPSGAPDCSFHTATPALNGANWWQSALLSVFRVPFLNVAQRSVNRKVQGSNPCPGAKSDLESCLAADLSTVLTTTARGVRWARKRVPAEVRSDLLEAPRRVIREEVDDLTVGHSHLLSLIHI